MQEHLDKFISKKQLILLYASTILTLCALYAAQPIQPIFEQEFALTKFQAVIFTTAMMLPSGIAPILYGFVLESFSAKKILRFSVLLLGILEILFSLSNHYFILLNLRALQGFLVPAILTSLTSYISKSSHTSEVQQAISSYIGFTIVGGFLGRYLSGLFSDLFGWRFFFFLLGIMLILFSFLLAHLSDDSKANFAKPKINQIRKIVFLPQNFYILISMFLIFFAFQGILNFIPFELRSIEGSFHGNKTGLVYAGYAIGLITSLNASRLIRWLGSETKTMLWGSIVYFMAIHLFHFQNYFVFFAVMFLFCLGMFTVHSVASGFINKITHQHKGITNGLYISFYYAGGSLGSFIPGVIYQYFGWHYFVVALSLLILLSFIILLRLHKHLLQIHPTFH